MSVDWDNIEPTPLAREIHAGFWKKMRSGGEIDRTLNGGEPIDRRAVPDEEIERIRANIETQLVEYVQAINEADTWWRRWMARLPKGFRAKRRHAAAGIPMDGDSA